MRGGDEGRPWAWAGSRRTYCARWSEHATVGKRIRQHRVGDTRAHPVRFAGRLFTGHEGGSRARGTSAYLGDVPLCDRPVLEFGDAVLDILAVVVAPAAVLCGRDLQVGLGEPAGAADKSGESRAWVRK